jgi:hypothetical protein
LMIGLFISKPVMQRTNTEKRSVFTMVKWPRRLVFLNYIIIYKYRDIVISVHNYMQNIWNIKIWKYTCGIQDASVTYVLEVFLRRFPWCSFEIWSVMTALRRNFDQGKTTPDVNFDFVTVFLAYVFLRLI